MSFAERLDDFFGDLAVTATIVTGTATSSASVYFDSPSASVLSGMVTVDAPSIVCKASVSMARGSTVTIGTDSYTVRAVEKLDDGALARATLESV